jgi:hypothetical protein
MKSITFKRIKKKAFIEEKKRIKKIRREKAYRSRLNLKIKVLLNPTMIIKKRMTDCTISTIRESATIKLYTKSCILN